MKFNLIKTEKSKQKNIQSSGRLGELHTVHGVVKTPAFMNVGTSAAIKGGVSSHDLCDLKCQIALCNTYHLHLRPGDDVIRTMGGIREFMGWNAPLLTDSGGFQIFSLSSLRHITEEGVHFSSHIDGDKIFIGPKESMKIQSNLASTIAMAFDECIANPADYEYVKISCDRTFRWLISCKEEMERLNSLSDVLNRDQALFGINQGGIHEDLRIKHMEKITKLDLDGYAIGGLSVGESMEDMYRIVGTVAPCMPENKPRYLMGVGKPGNIIKSVALGIDLFDCVIPSRNARHGHLFTWDGAININNAKYITDETPIDLCCGCFVCEKYTRSYMRHLFNSKEALGMRLAVLHNLYFYNDLMEKIRAAISEGTLGDFVEQYGEKLDRRI
ncbi:MAG: tRNA guanosine(34) transglycosylase Tgt [Oscillospiraceae bacterium]|nr:tRNA guanosine(34) transglycosylase Tgt [Oscillospiraceae bacterium]